MLANLLYADHILNSKEPHMDKKIQNRIFNFTSCNSGLHFNGNTIGLYREWELICAMK